MNPAHTLVPEAQPVLFGDRGCPFAHRVLALLEELGAPFELRQSTVGERPPGLELYTSSTRIPALVHGGLVLRESRVMLEYLAELCDYAAAYPADVTIRALHRFAMAEVDNDVAPLLIAAKPMPESTASLGDALDALEAATQTCEPQPNLLTIHVAPIWRAMSSWHPDSTGARAIEERSALRVWLDRAAALPCVAKTAVSAEIVKADIARAVAAGLIPETTDL